MHWDSAIFSKQGVEYFLVKVSQMDFMRLAGMAVMDCTLTNQALLSDVPFDDDQSEDVDGVMKSLDVVSPLRPPLSVL